MHVYIYADAGYYGTNGRASEKGKSMTSTYILNVTYI